MSEFEELMSKKAVALKYDPEKNGAPVVVASGMGYMAERITEAALDAGVPVLAMHSPFEVTGKLDCYMTYKGMMAVYLN